MQKNEIRAAFRHKRLNLTKQQVARYEDLLLIKAQQAGLQSPSCVMGYMADTSRHEPDPTNIIRWLNFISPGMVELMPRIQPASGAMDAVLYKEGQPVQINQFGIAEPEGNVSVDPKDIDLILIPMLAFDRLGNRVGYGKGYYDRFLHRCRPDCLKVGLCFFNPVEEISDVHAGDVRLNFCITPERIYQWPMYS